MYLNQEYKNSFRILKGGLISLVISSSLYGAPNGGIVTSGNANISQNGNTTNINQSSNKATINWQDFNIKSNETVNFNQPNSNSITLNRVIGNEKSIIDGALNANGQVWILNSNGTLFGKNAKVNTSGLLVTTKNLNDEDFQKGNYNFKGDSKTTIENLGFIDSKKYASFIANSVVNNGTIKVYSGTINLTGASEFSISLDENSNISLKVTKGVLDALVENNNLLIANGGNVYLTTNAKNELLKGVINNSGIIEANSLDDITGKQSEVIIFAHGGTANIDGEIKAKNSFVETSGENLNVSTNTKVIAKTWLLDPVNMTIESTGGNSLTGASVSAIAIQNALGGTNVELQADNNITVNQNITWSTDKQLKLTADNINVNATINNTNKTNGGVYFNASNNQSKVIFGTNGKVIVNNVYQLQWIDTALGGKYEVGSNIDASATSTWNSGAGFKPISIFTGTFDGLGNTISDLYINRVADYVALFGYTNGSTIKNIGLINVNITGSQNVGGLVGMNYNNSKIENSYVTGNVSGGDYSYNIGGLVGYNNNSQIKNSYFTGSVTGSQNVGGLVGDNYNSQIENSYALGSVSGYWYVGGLVGWNDNYSKIENSYVSGNVNGNDSVGGLIGWNEGTITNSWYDNETNSGSMADSGYGVLKNNIATALKNASSEWETDSSKGRGYGIDGTIALPFLKNVTKLSNTLFQDGLGTSAKPYTITNWTQLQNINNSNILTNNYHFNLVNNISSSTTDYTTLASSTANAGNGWKPIGENFLDQFIGTFDGLGFTISDLYINRSSTNNVGLFGYTIGATTTIRNLGLVDVAITGNNYVGGLVGVNYNNSQIENSYVSGNVSGNNYVGGLVGYNYNNSKIENSYASATVTRLSGTDTDFGGLVGYNNAQITNSFYDKTKNPNFDNALGTGKTTQEMSYGGTFKNAFWDIVADSSVTSLTPIRKWDSVNNKYIWAISPLALNYNLGSKSTTYNGSVQNLSDFYSSAIVIPSGYEFLNIDYKFQKDGNDVTGYKNAETYSNIKVALDESSATDEFLTLATTGNIYGNLTINKSNATITANSMNKVYNGQIQSLSGYSVMGLVGGDRILDLTGISGDSVSGINVGEYNTNLSGSDNNYNLIFINGKLAILAQNNPTPVKQKINNNVQKVIASINPSIFSNQFLSQTTQNSLNSNIRTPSFNSIGKTKIINEGIKIPENTATKLTDLESWEK